MMTVTFIPKPVPGARDYMRVIEDVISLEANERHYIVTFANGTSNQLSRDFWEDKFYVD